MDDQPGRVIGYRIGDQVYAPEDVTIIRAAPPAGPQAPAAPRQELSCTAASTQVATPAYPKQTRSGTMCPPFGFTR